MGSSYIYQFVGEETSYTPLIKAIKYKDMDIIKARIGEYKTEANKSSMSLFQFETTSLIWAMQTNQEDILKILLDNGMEINGEIFEYALIFKDNLSIVKMLIDYKPEIVNQSHHRLPIIEAIHNEKYELALLFIEKGADVNVFNECDEPLLWLVVHSGQKELVQKLVEHGADVNSQDKHGETPLIAAIIQGNLDIATYLIKMGANINELDYYQTSPLIWAIVEEQPEMVKLLIQNGANVHAKGHNGETALDWAKKKNRFDIEEMLLKANDNSLQLQNPHLIEK